METDTFALLPHRMKLANVGPLFGRSITRNSIITFENGNVENFEVEFKIL